MPNSSLITDVKNDMLVAMQNDDEIVNALGVNDDEDIESLIGVRMFPHWFVPDTQETVKTYICIEVNINSYEKRYSSVIDYKTYDIATIEIYILSHQKDLYMNKSGISAIRTDYLSCLIDKKFNGSTVFGIGELQRISNEWCSTKDNVYRYRRVVFQAVDFNKEMCNP